MWWDCARKDSAMLLLDSAGTVGYARAHACVCRMCLGAPGSRGSGGERHGAPGSAGSAGNAGDRRGAPGALWSAGDSQVCWNKILFLHLDFASLLRHLW